MVESDLRKLIESNLFRRCEDMLICIVITIIGLLGLGWVMACLAIAESATYLDDSMRFGGRDE